MSRWAPRDPVGSLVGPTGGTISEIVRGLAAVAHRDFKKGDVDAMLRLIPGTALPGIKTAISVGAKPYLLEAVE
ncbi:MULTISPECIES: hypothetical protein [unclassified Mesorhizobium]|uniref:hypothetical protein n=1 Tax=unclassified Mesorhizobium TaxID=325217 RepID=UPI0016769730|nr:MULTISPECIES: hypothetical protein [unclassified Mesorhizobium]